MNIDSKDLEHLRRAVDLAEAAVDAGDEPFGSVLVADDGTVPFEDHNHISGGDRRRHPEFAITEWAVTNMTPEERSAATVYTSGEHCAMCAAAHGWVGLGRIVYATSTEQLGEWLSELGAPKSPIAPLAIREVVPEAVVDGPEPALADRVRTLHARYYADH